MTVTAESIARIIDEHTLDAEGRIVPGWDSYKTEHVATPWGADAVQATFDDPLLHGWMAMVVADTVPQNYDTQCNEYVSNEGIVPERVSTLVVRFPRMVLSEFNTHRAFSRNSASSRARSFKTTMQPVMDDPYVPLFTRNMKGMGGTFAGRQTWKEASVEWLKARDRAAFSTLSLLVGPTNMTTANGERRLDAQDMPTEWERIADTYMEAYRTDATDGMLSIHKQNANRLLEPFMWHETLVTSTYWQNFFDLRISEFAQPEIKALAILMRAALRESQPTADWLHLPFVARSAVNNDMSWHDLEKVMLASASECARISYKDRSTMQNRNGSDLGRKLLAQRHLSPFEHIAVDRCEGGAEQISAGVSEWAAAHRSEEDLSTNLSPTWIQFRRMESAREQ